MQNDFQQLSIYHNKVYLPQVTAFLKGVHPDICSGHGRGEENMLHATDIFVFIYPKSEMRKYLNQARSLKIFVL